MNPTTNNLRPKVDGKRVMKKRLGSHSAEDSKGNRELLRRIRELSSEGKEKDRTIEKKDRIIEKRDRTIEEKDRTIEEKTRVIDEMSIRFEELSGDNGDQQATIESQADRLRELNNRFMRDLADASTFHDCPQFINQNQFRRCRGITIKTQLRFTDENISSHDVPAQIVPTLTQLMKLMKDHFSNDLNSRNEVIEMAYTIPRILAQSSGQWIQIYTGPQYLDWYKKVVLNKHAPNPLKIKIHAKKKDEVGQGRLTTRSMSVRKSNRGGDRGGRRAIPTKDGSFGS